MPPTVLPKRFYTREDVVQISRDCLGKHLVTVLDGIRTSGVIVETEAYAGPTDKASHAYNNRRTPRTEPMFAEGGIAYVYLCYGIHHLFNIVTHSEGVPHAVLIRALEPVEGIPTMCQRRKLSNLHPRLTNGPGSLSAALGIHTGLSGTPLKKGLVWLEDHGTRIRADQVVCSPRVGVGYAGDHAHRPWRFRIKGSPWTSPAK